MSQSSPATDGRNPFPAPGSLSPETNRPGSGHIGPHPHHSQFQDAAASPYSPLTSTPPGFPHPNGAHPNGANYMRPSPAYGPVTGHPPPHQSPDGPQRPSVHTNVGPYEVMSPTSQHGFQGHPNSNPQSAATPYSGQQNFPPFTLPPSNFAPTVSSATVTREGGQSYAPHQNINEYPHVQPHSAGEMVLLDNMTSQTTIPVFGSDSVLNRSPNVGMPEDFMAYLFNTQAPDGTPINGMMPQYDNK